MQYLNRTTNNQITDMNYREESKLSGFVDRFKHMVGLVPEAEGDEEDFFEELYGAAEEEGTYQENPINSMRCKKNNLKVVSHPNSGAYEVMVIEPKTFEDSLEAVNNLRNRKSLILNLHLLDSDDCQRVVDFLSGATHALDGHQQKVGDGVFLFTPKNINIAMETEKTRLLKDAFWKQA